MLLFICSYFLDLLSRHVLRVPRSLSGLYHEVETFGNRRNLRCLFTQELDDADADISSWLWYIRALACKTNFLFLDNWSWLLPDFYFWIRIIFVRYLYFDHCAFIAVLYGASLAVCQSIPILDNPVIWWTEVIDTLLWFAILCFNTLPWVAVKAHEAFRVALSTTNGTVTNPCVTRIWFMILRFSLWILWRCWNYTRRSRGCWSRGCFLDISGKIMMVVVEASNIALTCSVSFGWIDCLGSWLGSFLMLLFFFGVRGILFIHRWVGSRIRPTVPIKQDPF